MSPINEISLINQVFAPHDFPVNGNNSGISLSSLQDFARAQLIYSAGLSTITVRRFEQSFPSEFLRLGQLVSMDGAASADFARMYVFGLLFGQFPQVGDEAYLGKLYNITFGVSANEELFTKSAKFLITNSFSQNSVNAVEEVYDERQNDVVISETEFEEDVELFYKLTVESPEFVEHFDSDINNL